MEKNFICSIEFFICNILCTKSYKTLLYKKIYKTSICSIKYCICIQRQTLHRLLQVDLSPEPPGIKIAWSKTSAGVNSSNSTDTSPQHNSVLHATRAPEQLFSFKYFQKSEAVSRFRAFITRDRHRELSGHVCLAKCLVKCQLSNPDILCSSSFKIKFSRTEYVNDWLGLINCYISLVQLHCFTASSVSNQSERAADALSPGSERVINQSTYSTSSQKFNYSSGNCISIKTSITILQCNTYIFINCDPQPLSFTPIAFSLVTFFLVMERS